MSQQTLKSRIHVFRMAEEEKEKLVEQEKGEGEEEEKPKEKKKKKKKEEEKTQWWEYAMIIAVLSYKIYTPLPGDYRVPND